MVHLIDVLCEFKSNIYRNFAFRFIFIMLVGFEEDVTSLFQSLIHGTFQAFYFKILQESLFLDFCDASILLSQRVEGFLQSICQEKCLRLESGRNNLLSRSAKYSFNAEAFAKIFAVDFFLDF